MKALIVYSLNVRFFYNVLQRRYATILVFKLLPCISYLTWLLIYLCRKFNLVCLDDPDKVPMAHTCPDKRIQQAITELRNVHGSNFVGNLFEKLSQVLLQNLLQTTLKTS